MSNPNLIPTPIVDKNGVRSLRWKRPAPSTAGAAIPAPSLPKAEEALPLSATPHMAAMIEEGFRASWTATRDQGRMLAALRPGTLSVLEEHFAGNSRIFALVRDCLASLTFTGLDNAAALIGHHAACGPEGETRDYTFFTLIEGLQHHSEHSTRSRRGDYYGGSEEQVAAGVALMKAAQHLTRDYARIHRGTLRQSKYLISRELRELILRRPQDTERIITLLNERKLPVHTPEDISVVEALLDADIAVALSSGAL